MKPRFTYPLLTLLMAMILGVSPVEAQTARLQVIHNAADPAAAVVDVYVEEVSTDEPFLDDFAFRAATPFVDVPAGVELTVTVAPGTSTSAADGLDSFVYTLTEGETYQLIANGVLDPGAFASNPDGASTAFTLFVNAAAQEASTDENEVQFSVVHGATDAPTVGVVARDVATLVDDAAYGDITPYLGVPAGTYTIDVTTADGSATVATFVADLSGAEGAALQVLASGFLDPSANQDGAAFGLLAVFPDGTTALLPAGTVSNEDPTSVPATFELFGAYPNPVTTSATVRFSLAADAAVGLEVFDVLGRRVLRLAPEPMAVGDRRLGVDARSLPAGAYLYRLSAETATDGFIRTGRLTVVR